MSDDTMQDDSPRSVFGPAIDAELAVLASIEARYCDERTKLEASALPSSLKEHLREQLEQRRNTAREPHVLQVARLHEEAMMRTMFSGGLHPA